MLRVSRFFLVLGLLAATACGSSDDDDSCQPDDQDGIIGSKQTVLLSITDERFAVGGVASGSTQSNIAVQNLTEITLVVTNEGEKPHSFQVECRPSELPAGCPQTACFPDEANIPAIQPGKSVTVVFEAPAVEGEYRFTSTEPGDTTEGEDGELTGLVGQFVLM
jgi:hypothetical protein